MGRYSLFVLLITFPSLLALDRLQLANGDKLSGEVVKIEKDKLSFKTEYAGTIQVQWKQVSRLESEQEFQIEAENGWRSIGEVSREGEEFHVVSDDDSRTFEASRVVKLTPVVETGEPGFWQTWAGVADFGYNFARGNAKLNQSTARVNANYRTNTFKFTTDVMSQFSRQLDTPGADRHAGTFRFDRVLNPETFVYTLAGLERDARRKLNLRTNFGGGLGWKIVKRADEEISVLGGLSLVTERFRESATDDPVRSTGEGLLGLDLRKNLEGGVQVTTKMSITPDLVNMGRYRVALESGARLPVIGQYVWSLNIFNRFDSKPPVQAQRNDYGAISSFGITF